MKTKRFFLWLCWLLAPLTLTAQTAKDAAPYLDFLYQYLSLPDRTDYSRAFYEKNVLLSLKTRREMPWGARVPEREFRHFVLPVRVNNENLDNSREVFYKALKARVAGLSMADAVLEVNHWCHERVTYRPSDARTSSPLATIRTAYGRCGEESTLLVAALRSVGIPARQVYTPRWAHTDDNHAWVEAWADGTWYFLGACEPEPVLNLGWFNESASRGMLMHTKVFGHYDGPEEKMGQTATFTEINVIGTYAPASLMEIRVQDEAGAPVADALVEFKLYNYAEFYTVAQKRTDEQGRTSLKAGHGDLLLWVTKGGRVAVEKVSFGRQAEVVIVLREKSLPATQDWNVVPPTAGYKAPVVSEKQRAENNRRLAYEDSLRHAYEATLTEDTRGNHAVISQFLAEAPNRVMAEKLLAVISAKDRRDVPLEVLRDHAMSRTDTSEVYCRYVLNPRIEDEWLTPYKHPLRAALSKRIKDAKALVRWCNGHLTLDEAQNPQNLRHQPLSVWREKKTDRRGRNLFFVAAARSLGIPARLNEVNGKVQYYEHGAWTDVLFSNESVAKAAPQGKLLLRYAPVPFYDNPKYYIHFTISKIDSGRAQLLTFPEEATYQKNFAGGVSLDEGEYLLTTGTRMANGSVLARTQTFHISAGTTTELPFTLREDKGGVQVIGSLNAENLYFDLAEKTEKSLLATAGRGYYVVALIAPNHEPTNHTLRDIAACRKDFEAWGRKLILLFADKASAARFNAEEFAALPNTVVWGTDKDGKIMDEIRTQMKLPTNDLPVFLICDSFNRVVHVQQGYTIHLGEQLLKVIHQL